jgi:hypothetical protein
MNNDSDLHTAKASNTAKVHQSLEELHDQVSALEKQIKSGLLPTRSAVGIVEILIPQDQPPALEDCTSSTDWF